MKMRFRASHFPFTEPSMEVDINYAREGGQLKIGQGDRWLEILGSGMVHPMSFAPAAWTPTRSRAGPLAWARPYRHAEIRHSRTCAPFLEADLRWLRPYGFRRCRCRRSREDCHEIHPLLAEGSSRHDGIARRDLRGLVGVGLEVEEVGAAAHLDAFTVAHVIEAQKHPNADKLRLCVVETKDGTKQVVCGAPNARAGIKAIIALPASPSRRPAPSSRRQHPRVDPQAMLCSERELLISDEHNGNHRAVRRLAGGHARRRGPGSRRSDDLCEGDAQTSRCAGRLRHRPRSSPPRASASLKPLHAAPVAGSFASPITVALDFPDGNTKPCPLFVGRYTPRREERSVARLAAAPAQGHRPAPDLGPGGRDELHHLHLWPAPPCLRRR